ncbi:MAG: protein kinase [Planctomycetota bacterium]|nr:protein kinase [Planctomycetota bacterium]
MADSTAQHDMNPLDENRLDGNPLEEAGRESWDSDITKAAPVDRELPIQAAGGPVVKQPAPGAASYVCLQQETVISKPTLAVEKLPISTDTIPPGSTSQELGKLLEGTSLGHFRLEEFVGGGGMGAVFRAADTMLGRTVAVKVLSRDRTDTETLRRFQNEAQSAARLDHANIARVYYHGEDKGLHYIVFEFIEGKNIRQLVEQKGALPLDEAINYTLQVAEALEHASQQGVVHRDIKPSNILVLADGRAKLVDMGLARLHQSGAEELTASGVTLGTFDYISPEQARDPRAADVRSDLYSLGCTLYFMLTGRPPFPNGTVLQKLLSHSSEEPSDPRMFRPELDEEVIRIIHKLLAKQPAQRHQRPSELVGELLLLAERLNLTSVTGGGTVWIAPARSTLSLIEKSLPWVVPLAALLAAVLAVERFWPASPSSTFADTHRPILTLPAESRPPKPTEPPAENTEKHQSQGEHAAGNSAARQPDAADPERLGKPASPAPPASRVPDSADQTDGTPSGSTPSGSTPSGRPGESLASRSPPNPPSVAREVPPATVPPAATDSASNPVTPPSGTPGTPAESPPKNGSSASESHPTPTAEVGTSESGAKPSVSTRIIVGPVGNAIPEGAKPFDTLAAACQEAVALGVTTIELHFNGPREEHALTIRAKGLTIRNGQGFRPQIVFRPVTDESRMIQVSGTELIWQGVSVRLDLTMSSAAACSLFYLRNTAALDIQDSVLTIRNLTDEGRVVCNHAAVVELEGETAGLLAPGGDSAAASIPPRIELENCIVRGQAGLLRAEEVVPFTVVCQQSLLVLRDWVIDAGGARSTPRDKPERINLVLKNVTAVLQHGLCRLSSDATALHQLDLVTDSKNSIVYVTDAHAALLERRGVSGASEVAKRLYVHGRDNFYPGATALLRINPSDDPNQYTDFGFERREESWYQEESPRFSLMWKNPPPTDRTEDVQTPTDYQLDDRENNPARMTSDDVPAGVDQARLPLLPGFVSETPPAPLPSPPK